MIDADAEKVVRKLARAGHQAYLVGGCVRDLLLERTPKDFDVATSATPGEIRALFRNCRIIGRRFRLAHIIFGSKIIETSTFRANPQPDGQSEGSLLIRRDNVFGSVTEDARRRDFTINALFYDVETQEVIDHVGGLDDLRARLVRTIGAPDIRLREDPVRILRAIKFAARLGFEIEPTTYQAILRHRDDIRKCAPPRVIEEFFRLLRGGAARRSMELLGETGIDEVLSPYLAALLRDPPAAGAPRDDEEAGWHELWADEYVAPARPDLSLSFASAPELARRRALAWRVFERVDGLVSAGYDVSNALLLAAIVYPFVLPNAPSVRAHELDAMLDELARPLAESLRAPRRDVERMRMLIMSQRRLDTGRRQARSSATMARRDYHEEALILGELMDSARNREGQPTNWRGLLGQSSSLGDVGGRQRNVRRRRRRREFDDADDGGDDTVFG